MSPGVVINLYVSKIMIFHLIRFVRRFLVKMKQFMVNFEDFYCFKITFK